MKTNVNLLSDLQDLHEVMTDSLLREYRNDYPAWMDGILLECAELTALELINRVEPKMVIS